MPKFKQSYFKPTFDYDKSLFEGLIWQEPNSKGTGTYDITLEPKGFTCDCPGFSFRGKCKHSQQSHMIRVQESHQWPSPPVQHLLMV